MTYETITVGVGLFPGMVCEHEWCQPDPRPAVVYVDAGAEAAYLCARHFAHMIERVAAKHVPA